MPGQVKTDHFNPAVQPVSQSERMLRKCRPFEAQTWFQTQFTIQAKVMGKQTSIQFQVLGRVQVRLAERLNRRGVSRLAPTRSVSSIALGIFNGISQYTKLYSADRAFS